MYAPAPATVYCIAPDHLVDVVRRALSQANGLAAGGCALRLVSEARSRDRRRVPDRRSRQCGAAGQPGRRLIRNAAGRRIADRREETAPIAAPHELDLPRHVASELRFVTNSQLTKRQNRDIDGARLAIRFQAGDAEAFAAIYRSYYNDVHAYMCVLLGDELDAEDETQQVFVKILRALPRYEHHTRRFGGWVFAIARNSAFDAIRRRRALPTDPAILNSLRDTYQREEFTIDEPGDFDLVHLIDSLPALQREVVLMRYALGMSNSEVASALDRSPDSISGIHYRALATLEQALAAAHHPAARRRGRFRRRRVRVLPAAA